MTVKSLKNKSSWLLNIVFVLVADLLTNLIGYLLEVPSARFSFREGFKSFAGWVLLFAVSIVAVEALFSVYRKLTAPPEPPPADDPYLRALAEVEKGRMGDPAA
jgi:hypothetical protein